MPSSAEHENSMHSEFSRPSNKTDYHVHPDYSIDALPIKMRDYCFRAVELGLREICFTTHFECDPVRRHIDNFVFLDGKKHPADDLTWLDSYFKEIEDARKEFGTDGLKVRAGIEIGYEPGQERKIEKVLRTYEFDFVLGAIHCLDHIAISSIQESPRYFRSHSISEMQKDYFNSLKLAVETGLFHCIAHVDLYRRYGIKYYGHEILTVHQGAIEPILKKMAQLNIGLEINTSSLRRGSKEFHPSKEIVSMAVEAGIKIFTVGSDAHSLEDLGGYIDKALAFLDKFKLSNHIFINGHAYPYQTNGASPQKTEQDSYG